MGNGFFQSYFLASFRDAPYVLQRKSSALMSIMLVILPFFVLVFFVFLFLLPEILLQASFAIVLTFIAAILSLVLLRKGNYDTAANLFIIIVTIIVAAALFAKINRDAYAGYTTYIYHMIAIIVMTALFCRGRMLVGVSIFFVLSDVLFFVLVRDRLDEISLKAAKVGLVNSSISIVLVFAVARLIIRITEDAMSRSEDEARKSREQYEEIEQIHYSVGDSSEKLASSSEVLAKTAVTFSENSQNQAASAEEITSTIEEVSAGIESIARGADEQANRITGLSEELSELSGKVTAMNEQLNVAVGETTEISTLAHSGEESLKSMDQSMSAISRGSNEMSGIVEIINTISDQINLLSLNATIEAARAGEEGRGFAVVAEEISKLAEKTAVSMKEIEKLISQNNDEIIKGASTMSTTAHTIRRIIDGVASVSGMVEDIAGLMSEQRAISDRILSVGDEVQVRSQEIRVATEEQKAAISEIAKSISSVNDITQLNASEAENLLAHVRGVERMADQLSGMVKGAAEEYSSTTESAAPR